MTKTRTALRMGLLVVALVGSACTGSAAPLPSQSPGGGSGSVPPAGALAPPSPRSLCRHPNSNPSPGPTGESLPPAVAKVATQVEEERALRFRRPVTPEPVSHERLVDLLQSGLDQEYPAPLETRRQSILDFAGTQIVGFYDTQSHRLVFQGSSSPTPFQQFTLAHELTHALQDQAFGLSRLDQLIKTCRDERFLAFLSLAEGDAVESQVRWAQGNLTAAQIQELNREVSAFPPPPSSTPPFVQRMLQFPYTSGRAFVQALVVRGGLGAVNEAFRNPPDSTEQILHPDRYPADQPRNVNVPNIREKLGGPWKDLDVEEVGEAWLEGLLELRLPADRANQAGLGWDGGQYRAWALGDRTAVLMQTVWDTSNDAKQFADAMETFARGDFVAVERRGAEVDVLFGSDQVALEDLRRAAG